MMEMVEVRHTNEGEGQGEQKSGVGDDPPGGLARPEEGLRRERETRISLRSGRNVAGPRREDATRPCSVAESMRVRRRATSRAATPSLRR